MASGFCSIGIISLILLVWLSCITFTTISALVDEMFSLCTLYLSLSILATVKGHTFFLSSLSYAMLKYTSPFAPLVVLGPHSLISVGLFSFLRSSLVGSLLVYRPLVLRCTWDVPLRAFLRKLHTFSRLRCIPMRDALPHTYGMCLVQRNIFLECGHISGIWYSDFTSHCRDTPVLRFVLQLS